MPDLTYLRPRLDQFWWLARERYSMRLRRLQGLPRSQWTTDPVLSRHHFCNVFRADDRTSVAIRAWAGSVDDPWKAVLYGRLVNRAATVDALSMIPRPTPRDLVELGRSLGINTNAYRLNTPRGLNSVEGLGDMAEAAAGARPWAQPDVRAALRHLGGRCSQLTGFVGYQMVLDLVDLGLVSPDFDDGWGWPGPGAGRGAALLLGISIPASTGKVGSRTGWRWDDEESIQQVMRRLLRDSLRPDRWPWPERPWSIHEAEFMLCEYDKWLRRTEGTVSGRLYKSGR